MTLSCRPRIFADLRRTARAIVYVVMFFTSMAPAVHAATAAIEGDWYGLARSKGGIGTVWTFEKEGTVSQTYGAIVDFRYVVDGNRFTLKLKKPQTPEEDISLQNGLVELSEDHNTLTLAATTQNPSQRLERVGEKLRGRRQSLASGVSGITRV